MSRRTARPRHRPRKARYPVEYCRNRGYCAESEKLEKSHSVDRERRSIVSGHLKTGHSGAPQNRPVGWGEWGEV